MHKTRPVRTLDYKHRTKIADIFGHPAYGVRRFIKRSGNGPQTGGAGGPPEDVDLPPPDFANKGIWKLILSSVGWETVNWCVIGDFSSFKVTAYKLDNCVLRTQPRRVGVVMLIETLLTVTFDRRWLWHTSKHIYSCLSCRHCYFCHLKYFQALNFFDLWPLIGRSDEEVTVDTIACLSMPNRLILLF